MKQKIIDQLQCLSLGSVLGRPCFLTTNRCIIKESFPEFYEGLFNFLNCFVLSRWKMSNLSPKAYNVSLLEYKPYLDIKLISYHTMIHTTELYTMVWDYVPYHDTIPLYRIFIPWYRSFHTIPSHHTTVLYNVLQYAPRIVLLQFL